MRCLMCESWSWRLLCPKCQAVIAPSPQTFDLGGLRLITFYDYDEIAPLLKAKYRVFGSEIFKVLAEKSFRNFFADLKLDSPAVIAPIDDLAERWFSHTAVLARNCSPPRETAIVRYGSLRAESRVKYAGETLAFRRNHPRKFVFKNFPEKNAIILDDLVTTGSTILEAAAVLEDRGKTALFAIALAKAK
ncbi:MAG: ComF family protein [Helicobacteraceae bacterium]|nr:ComF family protein [Helicobacteraceae bacterium]